MLLLVVLACLFVWWLNWSLYWWKKGVPCTTPLPILGNCFPFVYQSAIDFFNTMYYKFPNAPYVGFFMFKRPVLLLKDTEIIMEVLEKKATIFASHGMHTNKSQDPLALGVFHLNGSEWKSVRAKLSAHFSPAKVKVMSSVSETSAYRLKDYLDFKIKSNGPDNDTAELNMREIASLYTSDSTALALFGIDSNAFRDGIDSEFVDVAKDLNTPASMFKIMINLVSPFIYDFFKITIFSAKANSFILDLMGKLMQARINSPLPRPDFIQDMLQFVKSNKEYDESLVISQGTVMWAGGVETSANTLAFALYELALNQELQEEIRTNLNNEDGQNLIKLVVTETLRKYPVFIILTRSNLEPIELSTGLKLEKNTLIIIPTFSVHRDPNHFEKPEDFNPHRDMPKGAYLPFGAGPRTCLGMRLALSNLQNVISTILRNYTVMIGDKGEIPVSLERKAFFTSPANGIWLKIKAIK